jgi:hypothetical protein
LISFEQQLGVTLPLAQLCPDWNNWTQKPPSAQFTTLNGIRSDRRHLLKAFAAPLESLFNTIVMISVPLPNGHLR